MAQEELLPAESSISPLFIYARSSRRFFSPPALLSRGI